MGRITIARGAGFPIGALSRRSGCKVETIRYYERIGLLPRPARTAGGHRLYAAEDLRRLIFIRRSRELGFGIDRIRELLALAAGGGRNCPGVKSITLGHIEEVRRRRLDLMRLETALRALADQCSGEPAPACPVIDALSGDAE